MLSGREKLGKGSFMLYLLGRLEQGGQETVFGSLPERPIKAVIYTEEPVESIREKLDAFGLEHARIVYHWQLAHLRNWREKASALVRIAAVTGAEIVFVDNISRASAVEEESGNELSRLGLEPLISCAKPLGLAVIIDHHHKKGRDSAENMSRGGTSLPGAVDVKLDMFRIGKRTTDRRRKLTSLGRIRRTNWERSFEQTEDRRDYLEIETPPDREALADYEASGERISDLFTLNGLGGETTVKQFATLLGDVHRTTAKRRLDALEANGLVTVERCPGKPSVYRVKPLKTEGGVQ
jgi:DNA-binding transcriptional ArsR family regulator